MREHLEFLDLSPKESALYLAGLKHGSLPASALAELIDSNRVSVYGLLESLIQKGLAERNAVGKRTEFAMKNPETVRSLILEKQKQTEKLLSGFAKELKTLSLGSLQNEQTNVRVFKGMSEVFNEIKRLAKHKAPIFWMGNLHALIGLISEKELFQIFSAKRMKHQTTTKAIADPSIDKLPRFREAVGGYRQFRFLPITSKSILALWTDTVGVFSASATPTLIFIRDANISALLKTVFDSLWETLPKS